MMSRLISGLISAVRLLWAFTHSTFSTSRVCPSNVRASIVMPAYFLFAASALLNGSSAARTTAMQSGLMTDFLLSILTVVA